MTSGAPQRDLAGPASPTAPVSTRGGVVRQSLRWLNVGARGAMELILVVACGLWGSTLVEGTVASLSLAVVVPAVVFGFWGLVDLRSAGTWAEPARLTQELVVTGLVALAVGSVGHRFLALALVGLSLAHHVATYLLGDRLIRPHRSAAA